MAAAEEVNEDCEVKDDYRCDEEITGTSDMLCTCEKACYKSLNGVAVDEGGNVAMVRTGSARQCEKACSDEDWLLLQAYLELKRLQEQCGSATFCHLSFKSYLLILL